MSRHLHIVCLDVPYPADYGGVFDLFYKLKYLKNEGVSIHLHCFEYGRGEQDTLNQYCETVHYYKRQKGIGSFSFEIPYIVSSRNSNTLKQNLKADNYPVLLEGIHCTLLLYRNYLSNRKVILRAHNIEFEYYRQLAGKEASFFRKLYFVNESRLLREYEEKIAQKTDLVLTVSSNDARVYQNIFHAKRVNYLPVFVPWNNVSSETGNGDFCLYHGNLSVNENEEAAIWLIEKVFSNINVPLIIAGKNPTQKIISAAEKNKNISVIPNPSEQEMDELIRLAQVNVLPSFSNTGVKLKLLHALFCGRHCIVNKMMIDDTGLENICSIADTEINFQFNIQLLFHKPFSTVNISERQNALRSIYNNEENAKKLIKLIYQD